MEIFLYNLNVFFGNLHRQYKTTSIFFHITKPNTVLSSDWENNIFEYFSVTTNINYYISALQNNFCL